MKTSKSKVGEKIESVNIGVNFNGQLQVKGYKSFKGMVQMLDRQNKRCKKLGIVLKFEVVLPLK